tara:strand:+ start:1110 stop:1472 length:363 start_codon:yes stop_codon:yes gene_type:complete
MLDYKIKKIRQKLNKRASCTKYFNYFEIVFTINTAREQFVFEESTNIHDEYVTAFQDFTYEHFNDIGIVHRHYKFNYDQSINGIIHLNGFTDREPLKMEDAFLVAKWVKEEMNKINQNLI